MKSVLLFGAVGPEILVIVVVVVILAITNKIGPVAESAGKTLSNFKGGIKEGKENFEESFNQNTVESSKELQELEVVDETLAEEFADAGVTTRADLQDMNADELQTQFDLNKSEAIELASQIE